MADDDKLQDACPLIEKIDATVAAGQNTINNKAYVSMVSQAQDIVRSAVPEFKDEHDAAMEQLKAVPNATAASPAFGEVVRTERKGQQIIRDACNPPVS